MPIGKVENLTIQLAQLGAHHQHLEAEIGESKDELPNPEQQLILNQQFITLKQRIVDLKRQITAEQDIQAMELDLSVTPSSINVVAVLKNYYLSCATLPSVFEQVKPLPIAECYINLAIVQQQKPKQEKAEQLEVKEEQRAHVREEHLSSFSAVYAKKQTTTLDRLFVDQVKEGVKPAEIKRIMVLGNAGIGKSALCQYIAHKWAMGSLWQEYTAVIWLPLRELVDYRDTPRLANIVCYWLQRIGELSNSSSQQAEQIAALEEQLAANNFLVILDGYDEVASLKYMDTPFARLLHKLLQQAQLMVTSRPQDLQHFADYQAFDRTLETIGFTDDNIVAYIKAYALNLDSAVGLAKSARLIKHLQANPNLWGIAHVPININLICGLWFANDVGLEHMDGLTDFYRHINAALLEQYDRRTTRSHPQLAACLAHLAHTGLANQQQLLFSQHELRIAVNSVVVEATEEERAHCLHDLQRCGLLRAVNPSLPIAQREYSFLHLTFQEYWAAYYLAESLVQVNPRYYAALEHLQTHKYRCYYQIVCWFTAGLVAQHATAQAIPKPMLRFWDALQAQPRDLIGLYHLELSLYCLNETPVTAQFAYKTQLQQETSCVVQAYLDNYKDADDSYEPKLEKLLTWMERCKRLPYHMPQLVQVVLSNLCNSSIQIRRKAVDVLQYVAQKDDKSVIKALLPLLQDKEYDVQRFAVAALEHFAIQGDRQVIDSLLLLLQDKESDVRYSVFATLNHVAIQGDRQVIDLLLLLLQDENRNVRRSAFAALEHFAIQGDRQVIDSLLLLLQDEDHDVRYSVVAALEHFAIQGDRQVIDSLLLLLQDEDHDVRYSVVAALKHFAIQGDRQVIDSLLLLLQDKESGVRYSVVAALKHVAIQGDRQVIDSLLLLLQDKESDVRYSAFATLNHVAIQGDRQAIDSLLPLLQDKDRGVRYSVVTALKHVAIQGDRQVIDSLLLLLQDRNRDVRYCAVAALNHVAIQGDRKVIDSLLLLLQDRNRDVRYYVFATLKHVAIQGDRQAIDSLLLLQDKERDVRRSAFAALNHVAIQGDRQVIDSLLLLLQDRNRDVRYCAVAALNHFAIQGDRKVIDSLLPLLQDRNRDVRYCAVAALNHVAIQGDRQVIDSLLLLLQDRNRDVRYSAFATLKHVTIQGDRQAIDSLLLLQDKERDVRRSAFAALNHVAIQGDRQVIDSLLPLLQDKDRGVRYSVVDALKHVAIQGDRQVIDSLLPLLQDEESDVQRFAVAALNHVAIQGDRQVIDSLLPLLQDKDRDVRYSVVDALKHVAIQGDRQVIDSLLPLLQDEDRDVRRSAFAALKYVAIQGDRQVIDSLLLLLQDKDRDVRRSAVAALKHVAIQGDRQVIDSLLPLLQDKDRGVRYSVVDALKHVTIQGDRQVIDSLLLLLQDKYSGVRYSAFATLKHFAIQGDRQVIDSLLLLLQDKDRDVRRSAVAALNHVAIQGDRQVIDSLLLLLQDEDRDVRYSVVAALKHFAIQGDRQVIDSLLLLLQDKDSGVRYSVVDALKHFAIQGDRQVIDSLLLLLQDKDSGVRYSVVDALKHFAIQGDRQAIDSLLPLLQDKYSDVRHSAVAALNHVTIQGDRQVIDSLLPLLQDKDSDVQDSAVDALKILVPKDDAQIIRFMLELCSSQDSSSNVHNVLAAMDLSVIIKIVLADSSYAKAFYNFAVKQESKIVVQRHNLIIHHKGQMYTIDIRPYPNFVQEWSRVFCEIALTYGLSTEVYEHYLGRAPLSHMEMAFGDTPLHTEVKTGDLAAVRVLLQNNPEWLNQQHNKEGYTPLMLAVQGSREKIIKLLVNKKADLNAVANNGCTTENFATQHCPSLLPFLITRRVIVTPAELATQLSTIKQRHQYGDIATQQLFHQVVFGWTGLSIADICIQRDVDIYGANLQNWQGNFIREDDLRRLSAPDKQDFGGMGFLNFIAIRLRLWLEIYIQVQQGTIRHVPDSDSIVLELLAREIGLAIALGHARQTSDAIYTLDDETIKKNALSAQVTHHLQHIQALQPDAEYGYQTGFQGVPAGHCVYVSFQRKTEELIVRVDNLGYGSEAHQTKILQGQPYKIEGKQSYWVKSMPFSSNFAGDSRSWLRNYLWRLIRAHDFNVGAEKAIAWIYDNKKNAEHQGKIPAAWHWPYQAGQLVENCIMRSHNLGIELRLRDATLYKWLLRQEEMLLPCLRNGSSAVVVELAESKAVAQRVAARGVKRRAAVLAAAPCPMVRSQSSSSFFQESILPHNAFMMNVAKLLKVTLVKVETGSAFEDALVQRAGIVTSQSESLFRANLDNTNTYFKLHFADAAEYAKFYDYYVSHYPGLIKQSIMTDAVGCWKITMNNSILHSDEFINSLSVVANDEVRASKRICLER